MTFGVRRPLHAQRAPLTRRAMRSDAYYRAWFGFSTTATSQLTRDLLVADGDTVTLSYRDAHPFPAGATPDPTGASPCTLASDGGVFAFRAPFRGSMGAARLNVPVTGMVRYGNGYLMVGTDGGIFNFSDRPFLGSLGDRPPGRPIVAVASLR